MPDPRGGHYTAAASPLILRIPTVPQPDTPDRPLHLGGECRASWARMCGKPEAPLRARGGRHDGGGPEPCPAKHPRVCARGDGACVRRHCSGPCYLTKVFRRSPGGTSLTCCRTASARPGCRLACSPSAGICSAFDVDAVVGGQVRHAGVVALCDGVFFPGRQWRHGSTATTTLSRVSWDGG